MRIIFLCFCACVFLAGCSGDTATNDPAQVIVDYLQARVDGNEDRLRELSCAEYEANAQRDALSFQGREAFLQDVSCQLDGDNRVVCEGSIVATYQGEQSEFPIPNYSIVQEDGVWKMCGETE